MRGWSAPVTRTAKLRDKASMNRIEEEDEDDNEDEVQGPTPPTQGSLRPGRTGQPSATLGFEAESLRDSQFEEVHGSDARLSEFTRAPEMPFPIDLWRESHELRSWATGTCEKTVCYAESSTTSLRVGAAKESERKNFGTNAGDQFCAS